MLDRMFVANLQSVETRCGVMTNIIEMDDTNSVKASHSSPNGSIEISHKGTWVKVPALCVKGQIIILRGDWIKVAALHDEDWLESELVDPAGCVTSLKNHPFPNGRADILTFTQKLPQTTPKYRYPMEWESVAAVRLGSFQDWWDKLPQETRKNVRRSQKRGVEIKVVSFNEELIRGISDVNNDSPMRQRIRNVHYGKSLDQVRRDYSAFVDRSDFILAYAGDEVIGFLKIVYRGEIASILNLTPKASHYDKRPGNALIAKAVELCEKRGISYVTYGLFNYGNKQHSPLREFKIRSGFEEVLVPRFYVPLTLWGRLCIKFNLHRGLLGILPHWAITLGVAGRAKWYRFKLWMSRCSSMLERPLRKRQMGCSNPPAGSKL
jgi:hypothetical protein